jgi:splicing factor 3B subunit 3
MTSKSDLYLYNLTLQKPQAITNSVYGNFSAPKAQEILVSHGRTLELLRPDDETGKMVSILCTEVRRSAEEPIYTPSYTIHT